MVKELKTVKNTSYNAVSNTRYVYETTYYYDDVLDKKFTKRKLVGKIDPETGMEVKTGPVGRPRREFPSSRSPEGTDTVNGSPQSTAKPEGDHGSSDIFDVDDLKTFSVILANLSDNLAKLKDLVDKRIPPET